MASDITETRSTSGVKTALGARVVEKTVVAAALVWAASDVTESRPSRSLTDVGTCGVSTDSRSVFDEHRRPSTTQRPGRSESLHASSSQTVIHRRTTGGSDRAGAHDDVNVSSEDEWSSEGSISRHQEYGDSCVCSNLVG